MGAAAVLPARLRGRLGWLSLTPIDQSTPEGRAKERHRRVALTSMEAGRLAVFVAAPAYVCRDAVFNVQGEVALQSRFGLGHVRGRLRLRQFGGRR